MSAAPAPALVERRARIFRFGHYPAKRWGITAEEFRAANGESGEVPLGFDPIGKGHYIGKTSILDGETGTAAFSVEGDEVLATLRIPEWLDKAITQANLKLSAIFHPTEKVLRQVDFVEKPHLPDAVLFAEEHDAVLVTEDDEPVGFDDPAEEAGEPCDCTAEFAQAVHDLAASARPGLCRPGGATADDPDGDDDAFRRLHDTAVHAGAFCPGMIDSPNPPEVGMSDEKTTPEAEDDDIEAAEEEVTFSEDDMTPRERAMFRRMQAMQDAVSRLGSTLVEKDAVAFADEITRGKDAKADPAERDHIIRLYRRLAEDDARLPEMVAFSEGGKEVEGSRLDAFMASYRARPRTRRRDEKVAGVGFADLPIEPGGEPAADAAAEQAAREERRKRNQAAVK